MKFVTLSRWREKYGITPPKKIIRERKRREDMRDAGLGELRGVILPKRMHDEVRKKLRREYGVYKVKKDGADKD